MIDLYEIMLPTSAGEIPSISIYSNFERYQETESHRGSTRPSICGHLRIYHMTVGFKLSSEITYVIKSYNHMCNNTCKASHWLA